MDAAVALTEAAVKSAGCSPAQTCTDRLKAFGHCRCGENVDTLSPQSKRFFSSNVVCVGVCMGVCMVCVGVWVEAQTCGGGVVRALLGHQLLSA